MVVKTDPCAYTEYKIYPGRGQKFVAKDGKITFFISAKADSLWHQKIKAVKLTWSQAWRRMNKKGRRRLVAGQVLLGIGDVLVGWGGIAVWKKMGRGRVV